MLPSAGPVPYECLWWLSSSGSLALAQRVLSSVYSSLSYIRSVMEGGGRNRRRQGKGQVGSINAAATCSARPRGSVGGRASVACRQETSRAKRLARRALLRRSKGINER